MEGAAAMASAFGGRLGPRELGSLIAIVFGLVFVEVNSGDLPGVWPVVARIGGLIVAAALLFGLLRGPRSNQPEQPRDGGFTGRGYRRIVGLEVLALVVGLALINFAFHRPELTVAWLAVVVGVHFLPLGALWRIRPFLVLGATLLLLGVAGFVLGSLLSTPWVVGLVSGVCSGVALFATVAATLRRDTAVPMTR
jgi:hypothetical protein